MPLIRKFQAILQPFMNVRCRMNCWMQLSEAMICWIYWFRWQLLHYDVARMLFVAWPAIRCKLQFLRTVFRRSFTQNSRIKCFFTNSSTEKKINNQTFSNIQNILNYSKLIMKIIGNVCKDKKHNSTTM